MGDQERTVEQQRDVLFAESLRLRNHIVAEIARIHDIKITLREVLRRANIRQAETTLRQLVGDFLVFEEHVSTFVQRLATVTRINEQPINLNHRITFAIYIGQLTSQRDTLRSLLGTLGDGISSHRHRADTWATQSVSLTLLIIALLSLSVAVSAILEARKTAEEQYNATLIQQRILNDSRKSLESVGKTSEVQQALLKENLETSGKQQQVLQKSLVVLEKQLEIIREQQRLALERPDARLLVLYPQALSVVVTNASSIKAARDVLHEARFFNLSQPSGERLTYFGSRVKKTEYVRPKGAMGPFPLEFRPVPKEGDQVFGFITVQCPDCVQLRRYWIYLVVGSEGWYAEGEWGDYPFYEQFTSDNAEKVVSRFLTRDDLVKIRTTF